MQKIARAFFAIFFRSVLPTILEPGTGYANFRRFEKSPEQKAMIGY